MKPTSHRLYLASTPYHLLLTLAVQHRDGDPPASVFFVDEARFLRHAPQVGEAIRRRSTLGVVSGIGGHALWQYPFRCRSTARSARRFARSLDVVPTEIVVTNGMRPEAQRLFTTAKCSFDSLEDGLDAYVDCNQASTARWERAFHRAACGSAHPLSGDMINAHSYERFHVLAPDLARSPWSRAEPIPAQSLVSAAKAMSVGLPLPQSMPAITHLQLLRNSERVADVAAYVRSLQEARNESITNDPTTYVAVKAHPRESDPRMLAAMHTIGDYVVPHWIPVELLCEALSPTVSVSCGLTTFIVSSRVLIPGRRIHLDQSVSQGHTQRLQAWDPSIVWHRALANRA